MGHPVRRAAAALFVAALACACRDAPREAAGGKADAAAPAGVPVRLAAVTLADLRATVGGPGHVVALTEVKVRAPFAGTLTALRVADGDAVREGEVLGTIVARDSEAALAGAREMARDARTEAERADAARAVALAERNLVRTDLRSPVDGVVVSHAESAGDRVAQDQNLLAISSSRSLVFQVDVTQSELPRVAPGQPATVALAGRASPVRGTVHGVLPNASAQDFTAPVRIDFAGSVPRLPVGLFGTAHIVVGERRGVPTVPPEAVERDDVTGASRIATVGADGKARWIAVQTGLSDSTRVEILTPALAAGTRVVVSGQVGLPEGSPVSIER